eukprot:5083981-Prymnesium_polylepis.1
MIGVAAGVDCSAGNTNLTTHGRGTGVRMTAKYSQCVCYENWSAMMKVQREVNTNNYNEVFVGAYTVDAIFYTTPGHVQYGSTSLWANFTTDEAWCNAARRFQAALNQGAHGSDQRTVMGRRSHTPVPIVMIDVE